MSAAITADRAAVLVLTVLGAVGPTLAARTARVLDPELCVALAWERAGAGELSSYDAKPVRVGGQLVADPWGYPLRWEWDAPPRGAGVAVTGRPIGGWAYFCLEPLAYARSYGPDGEPSADDIVVKDAATWPEWQRLAAGAPWLVTLIGALYLALAWPILRSRPRYGLVDAGIATLVVLPLAPVAVALGATDAMAGLTKALPVVIPPSFAIPVSLWVLALLLAFAVRVHPRAESPSPVPVGS